MTSADEWRRRADGVGGHRSSTRPRGLGRGTSLLVGSVVALGLVGCTSGNSPKTTTTSSTIATSVPPAGTTSTVPVAGTTTSSTSVPPAPGQTATTSHGASASTTVAGRVVSKPSDNVRLGDSGSGVQQIQTALVAHGYQVAVDGKFGPQTAQAVKAFQQKNGLTQDGVVGPITWAKLQASGSTSSTAKSATSTTAKSATTTSVKPTTTTAH
jgi:peptidoglycan hydrolase-like protein with peptidoglycan-binding domain